MNLTSRVQTGYCSLNSKQGRAASLPPSFSKDSQALVGCQVTDTETLFGKCQISNVIFVSTKMVMWDCLETASFDRSRKSKTRPFHTGIKS